MFKVVLLRSYKKALASLICLFYIAGSQAQQSDQQDLRDLKPDDVRVGAERTDLYFPLLSGKKVGVVAHQASVFKGVHLIDTLVRSGILVKKILAPEHGFRGNVEAGGKIENNVDQATGLPVISLYGSGHKPKPSDLAGLDILLFDLQDVGARFYTYISTLHYVMEACAENNKELIVLDRPNPNGHYVDGPVLDPAFKSFTGMHPVPIIHGMTMGEYAQMINGEKWLKGGVVCKLKVIPVEGYDHKALYALPVKPSPNLPNMASVYLYPSLCLFEGTIVSVGRGTDKPFQQFGYPDHPGKGNVRFTPHPVKGASENPKHNGQECVGFDVSFYGGLYFKYHRKLNLYWIINMYQASPVKEKFFNNFFNSLAGNNTLKAQIKEGKKEEDIKRSWEPALSEYKEKRKKYLLYEDFQ